MSGEEGAGKQVNADKKKIFVVMVGDSRFSCKDIKIICHCYVDERMDEKKYRLTTIYAAMLRILSC